MISAPIVVRTLPNDHRQDAIDVVVWDATQFRSEKFRGPISMIAGRPFANMKIQMMKTATMDTQAATVKSPS